MIRFTYLPALFLSILSSVLAVWLSADAWNSHSKAMLFFACVTAVQAVSLLLAALRKRLHVALLGALLGWCILSGTILPLVALNYVLHHGAEGLVDGAGASGVVDHTGRFYSSTPPLERSVVAMIAAFSTLQVASAFAFWRCGSRKARANFNLPNPPLQPTAEKRGG